MSGHETIPDNNDQRLYPLLHPTNPKYSREVVAKRLADKQKKIQKSKEIFAMHQTELAKHDAEARKARDEESASKRERARLDYAHIPSYKDNKTGYGYLTRKVEKPLHVKHDAESDQFFRYNADRDRFELRYQGSADVVSFLKIYVSDESDAHYNKGPLPEDVQRLAFFTIEGEFCNNYCLEKMDTYSDTESHSIKHRAAFVSDDGESRRVINIDNIYCISEAISSESDRLQST